MKICVVIFALSLIKTELFAVPSTPRVVSPCEKTPGVLNLHIAKPLYFTIEKQLALSIGKGLTISATGQLESTASVQDSATPPLRGISPLKLTDNGLTLSYSDPLRVVGDQLTFNFTSPLRYENGSLTFNYTSPMTLINNSLAINVNTSKGLSSDNGTLAVNVTPDFRFNSSGALTFGIQSLWTFPTKTPNCTVFTESDSLLSLCLTKCGAHVLGSVSLSGVAGTMLKMTHTSVTVQFSFDDSGKLIFSPLANNTWGVRQSESPLPNPSFNALTFMPNSTIYSRGASNEPQNNYYVQTYLRGNVRKPILLTVTYNSVNSGYSLTFKWDAVANEKFATPTSSFCYVAEQ
ncbi:short fiber [simian adenovirus 7]|uniref:Short fiber n=1 Tax=Simian adenovirus serotype 7 TaxID=10532 RepID=Q0PLX5_ADES7|nr:short fiber [Simian adenovirus 7]